MISLHLMSISPLRPSFCPTFCEVPVNFNNQAHRGSAAFFSYPTRRQDIRRDPSSTEDDGFLDP